MCEHEHFEELCALAASGQIEESDWQSLRSHLDSCQQCAESLGAFGAMSADIVSTPVQSPGRISEQELRSRFFRRAQNEGWGIHGASQLPRFGRSAARWAAGAVAAGVLLATGIATGWAMRSRVTVVGLIPGPIRVVFLPSLPPTPRPTEDTNARRAKTDELEPQHDALRLDMQQSSARNIELEMKVSGLGAQVAAQSQTLVDVRLERDSLAQRLSESDGALTRAKAELIAQEVQMASQQNDLKKLTEQIQAERNTFEREKALLAMGSTGKDLIASRNLHIVDVYDDSPGKSPRSFGRVFYVEGKQLIFYAYDLPSSRNAAYYAWGKALGPDAPVAKLGIFDNDGGDQRRWVLRLDGAGLAHLDSVFVTAETGRDASKPRGKRLLYAVLGGQPNHP